MLSYKAGKLVKVEPPPVHLADMFDMWNPGQDKSQKPSDL